MDKKTKVYIVMNGQNASSEFTLDNDDITPAHIQKRKLVYKQEVRNIEEFDPDLVFIMSGWEVETDYIYGELFPLLEPWALRTGRPVIVQAPSFGPTNTILNGQYPWVTFERSTSFDIVNMEMAKNYLYNQPGGWDGSSYKLKSIPTPSNLFVCYNNRPCDNRTKMVDALAKHDLIKEGIVTYKKGTRTPEHMLSFQYFKGPMSLTDPLEEDFELHSKPEFFPSAWPKSYHTGLVDIVTESRILEKEFQMTEKTIKPIATSKPFLVLGCSGYHQWLKDTRHIEMYDEIFDYTFDSDTSVDARIEGICENINRIRNEDPIKIMAKVKDKVEHNLHTYIKRVEDLTYSIPKSIKSLIDLLEYGRLDIKCGHETALQDWYGYIEHWRMFSGLYSSKNPPWWTMNNYDILYVPRVPNP